MRLSGIGRFFFCLLVLSLLGCGKDDEERALYFTKSPDSKWVIHVAEHAHNGTFSTAESYQLVVVRIRSQNGSEEPTLIFSMESDGDASHNPMVTWVANDKISIIVANGSSIEHWSTRFRGIDVGVVVR